MQRTLAALFVLAAASAAPLAAHAGQIGLRVGLEAPLVTHTSAGGGTTYSIGDSLQPAINVLLSAYPTSVLGFDAEFREGFASTGTGYERTGTSIGPGVTFNPPLLPVYVRGSLPIHLEPHDVTFGLRAAAGFSFNLVLLSIYLEGALDFPLAGNNVTAFNTQILSLGGGAWFKF